MGIAHAMAGWTVPMVQALASDGNRYEVIDGKLFVTPTPSWQHQDAVGQLLLLMDPYLRRHRLGHAIIAPADVEYDERTMVEPDLFVVPLVGGCKPRTWQVAGRLLLAVEVLSSATARADRLVKRGLYQRHGVPEYWIVNLEARLLERWQPSDERPDTRSDRIEWRPHPAYPPLVIDLRRYFMEVTGE